MAFPCRQPGQVLMLVWLLLLILAPGREQSGTLPKAFLLLTPPWSTGYITWYYNDIFWSRGSETIQIDESGYYTCKIQRSTLSDPVRVEFFSEWLILQASYPIFEGDDVVLRCQGRKEENINEKTYYRNEKEISNHLKGSIMLRSVFKNNNQYHCTASGKSIWGSWETTSNLLKIHVQGNGYTPFCFFRKDQALGSGWSNSSELHFPIIWSEDSESYWCQAKAVIPNVVKRSQRSRIHVQRIPVSHVNLEIQPPGIQLIEGEDLFLICSVAKGTGTVTFSWHREGSEKSLGRKMQRALSAKLQIAVVREQDAGRYYCSGDNMHGPILIPASRPILTLRAPRVQAVVGDMVELHCEAQRGSPPSCTAPSGGRAPCNLFLTAEHSGNYSCEADNGLGAQFSDRVSLSIPVPVSRPVLILNPAGTQAMVGDLLELHCEAQRGSPPILYWFYHEDVILGNTSAPFGGGASFNLLLTTEHSGNYSCGADNGLGVQRSYMVTLNFTGFSMNKVIHITVGVIRGLLSMLGLAATVALVSHYRTQRKSGGLSATGTPRTGGEITLFPESLHSILQESCSPEEHRGASWSGPCIIGPQSLPHSESPTLTELQPLYRNATSEDDKLIYSQIWSSQHTKENPKAHHTVAWINSLAHSTRTQQKDEEPGIVYSEVKKAYPDDPAGQAHEDATESYENLP
ncbi:unnamed protein product [Nyctereutes procyonoides]|uniref:(raccoon dog) hypothetical protein n=1 Tax=Nyctereutes procyonoides TaxID=34880 RepID=A0A811YCT9_NYCPR|nr:unnamed protein product [Nyctereutes procyonoides]